MREWFERFEPPDPKELGWSETNALEMRHFSPFTQGKTWEDWHDYVKEHYPYRYKIYQFFRWLGKKKYNFGMRWYLFKSRFFIKQHLLNLNQSYNGYDVYEYGYCDPSEQVLYANFNILKEFVEKEEPHKPEYYDDDEHGKEWAEASREIYDLYDYWMVRRAANDRVATDYYEKFKEAKTKEESEKIRNDWMKAKDAFDDEEQRNLERLIKVRRFMWT